MKTHKNRRGTSVQTGKKNPTRNEVGYMLVAAEQDLKPKGVATCKNCGTSQRSGHIKYCCNLMEVQYHSNKGAWDCRGLVSARTATGRFLGMYGAIKTVTHYALNSKGKDRLARLKKKQVKSKPELI